jgi:hypothetical protein
MDNNMAYLRKVAQLFGKILNNLLTLIVVFISYMYLPQLMYKVDKSLLNWSAQIQWQKFREQDLVYHL